jgi:hypothetical protein
VYGVGDVARWYNTLFGTLMRIEHRTNAAASSYFRPTRYPEKRTSPPKKIVHEDDAATPAPT